jgi:membrane protease YdiL (CAAX protease family)
MLPHGVPSQFHELGELAHWSLVTIFFYAAVPWIVLAAQGKSIRNYGVTLHGFVRHAWIYGVMLCVMAPIVWLVSQRAAFLECYPFHRQLTKTWTDLLVWEALYALQFCALEFFFRGYLLFSLKRYLGVYSIAVMMVPYCMIHFRKPPAEIFASIIAGFALGTVALTTRSIWWGAALHIAVAWSMDALAIWRMM